MAWGWAGRRSHLVGLVRNYHEYRSIGGNERMEYLGGLIVLDFFFFLTRHCCWFLAYLSQPITSLEGGGHKRGRRWGGGRGGVGGAGKAKRKKNKNEEQNEKEGESGLVLEPGISSSSLSISSKESWRYGTAF